MLFLNERTGSTTPFGTTKQLNDEQRHEGAHEGRGLGDLFLGHIERCAVLLHLVDGSSGTLLEDYDTIINEIEQYGAGLDDKPRVTVLNKIDTMDDEERAFLREELEARSGGKVMLMSGASGEGTTEVLRALRGFIDDKRLREAPEDDSEWRP